MSEPSVTYLDDKTRAWVEEYRAARSPHHGMNGWQCETCRRVLLTIDIDPGVTPFILSCRVTEGCTGESRSMFYPAEPPPYRQGPTHEWYRPDDDEFATLDEFTRDHVQRGGLLLRERRSQRPSAYVPELTS